MKRETRGRSETTEKAEKRGKKARNIGRKVI